MNVAIPLSRRSVATLVVSLISTLALLATVPVAQAAKPQKGPGGLAFYDPPKKFTKAHGSLIWHRKARGLNPIAGAASNKLLLYSSKTVTGRTTAVSGSVSVPEGKPPKRGWPVITYAHGTTGTADVCAPTRIPASSTQAPYVTYIDPELEDWIDAGYAVVRTDYQGLGTPGPHGYLIGVSEGRAVLDIVDAARQLEPDIGKRYLIAGHSQGGHAALFAAGLADRYAKGLRLRGTVAYAPASHLAEQAELLPALNSPSSLTALATLIIEGAASASKQVQIQQLLSDPVLSLYPQVDETCLPELGLPDSLGGIAPSELIREGADTSPLYAVLGEQNPAVKTNRPILLAQGAADTTVFKSYTDLLNGELVTLGDDVDYRVYPGVTHAGIPAAAEADALAFFERRLPAG